MRVWWRRCWWWLKKWMGTLYNLEWKPFVKYINPFVSSFSLFYRLPFSSRRPNIFTSWSRKSQGWWLRTLNWWNDSIAAITMELAVITTTQVVLLLVHPQEIHLVTLHPPLPACFRVPIHLPERHRLLLSNEEKLLMVSKSSWLILEKLHIFFIAIVSGFRM